MWVPLSAAQGYCVDRLGYWIRKQAYNVLKCFRNVSHYWYYHSGFNGESEGITRGRTLGFLGKHDKLMEETEPSSHNFGTLVLNVFHHYSLLLLRLEHSVETLPRREEWCYLFLLSSLLNSGKLGTCTPPQTQPSPCLFGTLSYLENTWLTLAEGCSTVCCKHH